MPDSEEQTTVERSDTPPAVSPEPTTEELHETNQLDNIEARLAKIEGMMTAELLATLAILSESIRDLREQDNQPRTGGWLYKQVGKHD